ncbi:YkgJ family cysteine cluster protein, partial [Methanoregula sp.]|uniref:YkgJ family cysteine cluster protein n=1 Tax=Methanoregula sp. TaxID=2052170 RepID=UPI000CABD8F7
MAFECAQCGECCTHLGYVHTVIEERGYYNYLVQNVQTLERSRVTVVPAMRDLFDDRGIFAVYPHACPFFRQEPRTRRACCTVHPTRPLICREYECWRLLILNHRGRRAGRVRYRRMLITDDTLLERIWNECCADRSPGDDRLWEDEIT